MAMAANADKPALLINSCLGKMGQAVAEAATAAGVTVLPYTLCAEGEAATRGNGGTINVAGQQLQLVEPSGRDQLLQQLKADHPNMIIVDYTVPDVIHDMVNLYIKHQTPFVMGTTGGDRQKILSDVQAAHLYAVIAPQMGKQVSMCGKALRKHCCCWLVLPLRLLAVCSRGGGACRCIQLDPWAPTQQPIHPCALLPLSLHLTSDY